MSKSSTIYDTLIISDVHLGSSVCCAKELLTFLKSVSFQRLILLGDMFSDLDFSRLKKEHWEVLSYLRELSSPKRGIEIVWVIGNHDIELQPVMSHLVGIEVFDKYEWKIDDMKCIALHGHQFDPSMKMPKLVKFISWLFLNIQKIPGFRKEWSWWIDSITGYFQNISRTIEMHAIMYARIHQYDVICCGHTHQATHQISNGVQYYNSGCWVRGNGTYIAFTGNKIQVLQYKIN